MKQRITKLLLWCAALALLLAVFFGVAWWSIHTLWFANFVRARIVAALHTATGGRVELRAFTFNPGTLHAKVTGLAVHGTEPPGSLPLLSIESADIGLKLISIWRQDIDVQSVTIIHPEIHLLVNADGSTNIPTPQRRETQNPIQQLLNLKIKQLSVAQGYAQINNRRVPFQFISQDIGLRLHYNHAGPSYVVGLNTGNLYMTAPGFNLRPARIAVHGSLFKDRADINEFTLTTAAASSVIHAAGHIEHFAQPLAQANVDASMSLDELAQIGGVNAMLQNGRVTFKGTAHFTGATNQFVLNGKAQAANLDFVLPQFTLRHISAAAALTANNDGILLKQGQASARGAHFAGEGSIANYSFLQVQGQVSQVALSEVGTYLTTAPFPWSGMAHGPAHASAHLLDLDPDFIIGGRVDIDPGTSGIPTSGNVDISFHARGLKVEFGPSALQLPHSHLEFQGTLNDHLLVKGNSTDVADLRGILPIFGSQLAHAELPQLKAGGSAEGDLDLSQLLNNPAIEANVSINKFKYAGYDLDLAKGHISHSPTALSITAAQLQQAGARLNGNLSVGLVHWFVTPQSSFNGDARFTNLDVAKTAALFTTATLPIIQGVASGNLSLRGTIGSPAGTGVFRLTNLDAYGEQLNRVQFNASLAANRLEVAKGSVQAGAALLNFSGAYRRSTPDWLSGRLNLIADTNGFPLAGLSTVRKYLPSLNARAEIHLQADGNVTPTSFVPLQIDGVAELSKVSLEGRPLGDASIKAVTRGSAIHFGYSGDLRDTKFHGQADAALTSGTPIHGGLQLDRIGLATLKSLTYGTGLLLPIDGYLDGNLAFDGLLEKPSQVRARATIEHLQMKSVPKPSTPTSTSVPEIVLQNNAPILLDVSAGVLNVTSFEIDGRETSVKISGSVPFIGSQPIALKAVGKADLALFTLFDPNVRSGGSSELDANITGTLAVPNITGKLDLTNGSFYTPDLPNGLSDVNGTVLFGRNRATIQKLNAHSGGGDITLGGSLNFGGGGPLVYHLEAEARSVRVRYGNSISVTANSDLRLSGTSESRILSGTLTVTRIVFTPNADAGNLLAAASSFSSSPSDQSDFISGLHLDIGIESAPNLQVSTNLSRDVEAELQLRLRGTPDHPIVLGNITANQGDLKIFGTRFTLNRGEVDFVNTVHVEPVLDLDLETQARGVTVDITVSGTPSKLNFNYRSDPPLQPRDIIALLTVGRAPDLGVTNNAQTGSDVGALTSGVNSVLGQAISPVSNRLSKLFGITNIKIDPFVQGITNTPQARLSVEQQISRDVTITYVTNLSQTSEQIFRFEWALNRQFSIIALRDDNGEFGVDFQYKKQFK